MWNNAKWIWHPTLYGSNITCNFRREFTLPAPPTSAVIHISAQHFYRLFINGKQVGGLCSPAPSVFEKRRRYLTYDLTGLLTQGENVIAVTVLYLGGGGQNRTKGSPGLLFSCQGKMGSESFEISSDQEVFCTDCTGYAQHLPFREARSLTNSTHFSPAQVETGWQLPGFDPHNWSNAIVSPLSMDDAILQKQEIPEGGIRAVWSPTVLVQEKNRILYDCSEMLTGYLRVTLQGKAGTTLTLRYGELLEGERRYHGEPEGDTPQMTPEWSAANDKTLHYTDSYCLMGNGMEIWEENFTYKAFRYVELTGAEEVTILSLEAVKTATDFPVTGSFSCDDEQVNRLVAACIRTQENGLQGMPVDCPHREQAQYLGDCYMQSHTLLYNFEAAHRIFLKTIRDFADGQRIEGHFPWVCPCDWEAGGRYDKRMPEYDFLYLHLMWASYFASGDPLILKEGYHPAVRMLTHYLALRDETGLIPKHQTTAIHISDWPYPTIDEEGDYLFVQNCYALQGLLLMGEISSVLREDESCWLTLSAQLKQAIQKNFYNTEKGLYRDTPTSQSHHLGVQVLAFQTGLLEQSSLETILTLPVETSVILTYPYLRLLFDQGHKERAYDILTNPADRWGKMIREGARTIWEGFEDIESHSHAWNCYPLRLFQEYLLGIRSTKPGFSEVELTPYLPNSLSKMTGTVETPLGKLTVTVERTTEGLRVTVDSPPSIEILWNPNFTLQQIEPKVFLINNKATSN